MAITLTILALIPVFGGHAEARQHTVQPQKSQWMMALAFGMIEIDVSDVVGRPLPAIIHFRRDGRVVSKVRVPSGTAKATLPIGPCSAYVYVIEDGTPILVEVKKLDIQRDETSFIMVTLLEGSAGKRKLSDFDSDHDLALDRVELEAGTDPLSAASVPGFERYDWPSPVLSNKSRWYRGELHAHSRYGVGSESVGELVRRAERLGLDFLAITDRNTLQAASDPEFQSKSVVLIPAMEWGNDEMGVALIYTPLTFPDVTASIPEAQALCIRVQAQGGVFCVAHPLFPSSEWQWGLGHVNAIEVWCRHWREPPPTTITRLDPSLLTRRRGRLTQSIAIAAATPGFSANGQASVFWDHELSRGLRASVIAGSHTASPKVPMGEPLTYIYAHEKSLNSIMEGLRLGRTIVSSSVDGPRIRFLADVNDDKTIDAGVGEVIPAYLPTRFFVKVDRAKNKRLEVLQDGRPFRSTVLDSNKVLYSFLVTPKIFTVYRVRIVERATRFGFGSVDVLAMTSPIYVHPHVPEYFEGGKDSWIELERQEVDQSNYESLPQNIDPERTRLRPRIVF